MTSVSCSSSVTAHKSPPSDNRSKSCDTVCTSNSSCFFKRRKPMNPLAYSLRPTHHKTNPNSVKQRVMSAKMLKLRQLQSQLNDANFHLAEVTRENQTLRTLQKRQDKALSKYENSNADLPRLLHSHEEEIKVLIEKNRNLRRIVKDISEQLKLREEELCKTREQLFHLEKLNKDKHLTEREKLMDKMEQLKMDLQRSNEQVSMLNRKLMLETKISKQRLNAEIVKHKQCQKELLHAFDEIDRLTGLLDAKENIARPRNPKFNKNRDSMSMLSLKHYQGPNRSFSNERLGTLKDPSQTPVTEVKLEPLVNGNRKELENLPRKALDGFKAPMENIKQRLSSGSIKTLSQDMNGSSNHSENSAESRENSAGSLKSRPASSMKLEKLPIVQENRRIRERIKKENDLNRRALEEKLLSDDELLEFERLEKEVADEDVVVRYDCERDEDGLQPLVENESKTVHKLNENPSSLTQNRQREDNFDQKQNEHHSENDSDEELVSLIQKMKKNKKEETKTLEKPPNKTKRKNSDDMSVTPESVQSEKDLEKITENLDAAIQRVTENSKDEFDKKLGSYCSEVLSSVKNCSQVIKVHKESLENSKQDTDSLLEALKQTEKVETKLKKSFFNMDDDMQFVNEILNEEYKFRATNKVDKNSTLDKNSNIEKKSLVNVNNKKKLLATLRAIDNGDSIDSIEEPKQDNFITERLGNVAH